jgi:hypothetical protein
MGKYAEGNRVVDFALGTLITHDTYLNEQQDQLKGMLGPLRRDLVTLGKNASVTAGDDWDYVSGGGGNWYWEAVVTASVNLIVPVSLRVGQVITEVGCTVSGAAGSLGGQCSFYYGDPVAGLTAFDMDGVANCWDTGGVGVTTDYVDTGAPFPYTTVEDGSNRPHIMWFRFQAGTNANTHPCRLRRVWIEAQFGN